MRVVHLSKLRSRDQLQAAMALGADRAMLVRTTLRGDQLLQPLAVAKVFKAVVDGEQPDIVILGKQVSTVPAKHAFRRFPKGDGHAMPRRSWWSVRAQTYQPYEYEYGLAIPVFRGDPFGRGDNTNAVALVLCCPCRLLTATAIRWGRCWRVCWDGRRSHFVVLLTSNAAARSVSY